MGELTIETSLYLGTRNTPGTQVHERAVLDAAGKCGEATNPWSMEGRMPTDRNMHCGVWLFLRNTAIPAGIGISRVMYCAALGGDIADPKDKTDNAWFVAWTRLLDGVSQVIAPRAIARDGDGVCARNKGGDCGGGGDHRQAMWSAVCYRTDVLDHRIEVYNGRAGAGWQSSGHIGSVH